MAVLFRSKYPVETVYIPSQHRFISFVGGEYSTDDVDEIAVLANMYEHDMPDAVNSEDIPDQVLVNPEGEKPKRKYTKKADADA